MQPAAFQFNCSAYLTTPVGAAPLHTAEVALRIQFSGDAYLVCFFLFTANIKHTYHPEVTSLFPFHISAMVLL